MYGRTDEVTGSARLPTPRSTRASTLLADGLAGGSVALVLIPQALAYAEIAGVPAHIGLYASALPLIAAAFFASSPYLQTGPTALTALFAFGALSPLAEAGTREYILLASLLALLVGAIRLALGIVRLGSFAYVMSEPVVLGFTAGAAILILATQVPTMLGVSGTDGILENALDALRAPGDWNLDAVAVSALAVAVVLLGRRLHPLFPGVLVVVVGGVVWSRITGYDGRIVGDLPHRFLDPSLDLPWGRVGSLLVPAAVIAFVGFAEPASIARTLAAQDRQPWNASRDLTAQGVANIVSGLSGSFPIGGSLGRSALNRMAGARTRWSGAFTGLVVLAALPLAFLVEPLPRAVLGAIVAVVIFKLIRLVAIARLWTISPLQMLIASGTLIATLVTAPRIERGVLIGVALSVVTHLYREMDLSLVAAGAGNRVVIAPRGVLWFGTAHKLEGIVVNAIAAHDDVEVLEIDLTGVGRLDYTGAEELRSLCSDIETGGVVVSIVGVPAHARRIAGKTLTRWWRDPPAPRA
jgi:SulP family sulfate permease